MNSLPDKHTYKTTITQKLRNEIIDLTQVNQTWLEIGCDVCYTTETLLPHFDRLIALDLDPIRIQKAMARIQSDKIEYIIGTSNDIKSDKYDMILIDANHEYDFVMHDFQNIYEKNTAQTYTVIFHDYGLTASGVAKAVMNICKIYDLKFDLMGEHLNWNPLGGSVYDFEAAKIIVGK